MALILMDTDQALNHLFCFESYNRALEYNQNQNWNPKLMLLKNVAFQVNIESWLSKTVESGGVL